MIKINFKNNIRDYTFKEFNFILMALYLFSFSFLLYSCKISNNKNDVNTVNEKVVIGRIDLRKLKDSQSYKQLQNKIYNIEMEYKNQLKKISFYKDETKLKETTNKLTYVLEQKKQEYFDEFFNKLNRAIITVANKEKIGIVLNSDVILYGYKDITNQVLQTIDSNSSNLDINPDLTYSLKIAYLDLNKLKNPIDFEKLYKDKNNDILIIFDKPNVLLGGIDLTDEINKYISKNPKTKSK
ncbi:MAG: OmpH family outer membrane protein [bacterium]|nr:OmpH family outer membrane protein [bacterium]